MSGGGCNYVIDKCAVIRTMTSPLSLIKHEGMKVKNHCGAFTLLPIITAPNTHRLHLSPERQTHTDFIPAQRTKRTPTSSQPRAANAHRLCSHTDSWSSDSALSQCMAACRFSTPELKDSETVVLLLRDHHEHNSCCQWSPMYRSVWISVIGVGLKKNRFSD